MLPLFSKLNGMEIEKVKKRRKERALEKAQHEEGMALLARERAWAEFQDWEKKEEACLTEIHTKMLHKHLQRLEQRVDGEENLDTVYDLQPEEEESEPDVKGMHTFHLWKRVAVLEEQPRQIQEALASKPAPPPEDNFEMKAMKAMGIMEEGDAVLTGSLHL